MKERPILFSGPMVRAILAGTKTQTRRVVKNSVAVGGGTSFDITAGGAQTHWVANDAAVAEGWRRMLRCPYGVPGDRLWVREAWRVSSFFDALPPRDIEPGTNLEYEATPDVHRATGRYRHARFMPRWASRMAPELTDVRVQRLQDISEDDARAEGLAVITKDGGRTWKFGIADRDGLPGTDNTGWPWSEWDVSPRKAYARLWDSINGPGAWDANPWVWALTFKRVEVQP